MAKSYDKFGPGVMRQGKDVMSRIFKRFRGEESGQDLIEYALLAFLIACGAAASIGRVAAGIVPAFSNIALQFNSAIAGVGS